MAESARRRCNNDQKNEFVNYMLANKDLALGNYTAERQNEKWAKLAEELAKLGPNKSVDSWIVTWRDLKCRAKRANAKRAQALQKTGNLDGKVPVLSDIDEKILSIIGKATSEDMEVTESSITGAQPTRQSSTPPLDFIINEESSDTEEGLRRRNSPFPLDSEDEDLERPSSPSLVKPNNISRSNKKKVKVEVVSKQENKICLSCWEHSKVDGEQRNDHFANLIKEEFKHISPCMRTRCYVKILNYLNTVKGFHTDQIEVTDTEKN